jgi:hypothetical protein
MLVAVPVVLCSLAFAQHSIDEGTRALWDSTFLTRRPAAKAAGSKPRPGASATAKPADSPDGFVGITMWRLRRSTAVDEPGIRLLVHDDRTNEEWTPERIDAGSGLREGQRIRIGIETARAGYLYVIDREEYQGGKHGAPYLIFPTTRTRGGNNRVSPGMLIEIPGIADDPPYLRLARSRPDHVGEILTVLVTPAPLTDLQIGATPLKLNSEIVAAWEKQWGADVKRLEAQDQLGRPYTAAEKAAAAGSQLLTSSDPVPQTMYKVSAKPGDPVLVTLPLRIGK